MENPSTWSRATWMVHVAISRHGEEAEVIGLSLEALIVQMLSEAGYLTREALELPNEPYDYPRELASGGDW